MIDSEVSPSEFDVPMLMACEGKWYVVSNYCNDDGSLSIVIDKFDQHKDAYRFLQYKNDEISHDEYFNTERYQRKLRVRERRSSPYRCIKDNTLLLKYQDDTGAQVTLCPTCSGWDI